MMLEGECARLQSASARARTQGCRAKCCMRVGAGANESGGSGGMMLEGKCARLQSASAGVRTPAVAKRGVR
eukprot:1334637-Rhodomonas_salina.1